MPRIVNKVDCTAGGWYLRHDYGTIDANRQESKDAGEALLPLLDPAGSSTLALQ
ncbi:hypothetical protein [Thermogemmatispora sp.]|uniref:hypothetical protein n=1 Tax=Thermogemmatispora sp. TaxID=1968838 RepID=UPI001E10CA5B|nr:hypothetical protein [Thermogemmatispora sp.]MBX5451652.1 hypothetical protein [Thermogemmatispora sp.]